MPTLGRIVMRVDAPEARSVDRAVTEGLEALEGETSIVRTRKLSAAESRMVVDAITAAGNLLTQAATAASQLVTTGAAVFADIVDAAARAFKDVELQEFYRRWKARNPAGWQSELEEWAAEHPGAPLPPVFSVGDPALHVTELERWGDDLHAWSATQSAPPATAVPRRTPMDYATGGRTGQPDLKLKLQLGEGYRAKLRAAGAGVRAASEQAAALWPRLVGSVWPAGVAADVPKLRALLQNTKALRSQVEFVAQATRVELERFDAGKATELIQRLAASYAGGDITKLTDEALTSLIGKPLTSEAFIHRALVGLDMMADEADLLGPDIMESLLEVPGVQSFLVSVIQKSGYEHGYTFEVFLVVRELFQGLDPSKLWMQIVVGGKMGPDIGRLIEEAGQTVVRLIQAKSYRSLNELLRVSDTGEIYRQLRSDLLRLKATGFRVTGEAGQVLPISRTIEFKIDWFRLRKTAFRIDGIDAAELHAARESTQAVKDAFRVKYVDQKVAELNAMLDSPAFRAELGLADGEEGFRLEVEIVDRIFPDER